MPENIEALSQFNLKISLLILHPMPEDIEALSQFSLKISLQTFS